MDNMYGITRFKAHPTSAYEMTNLGPLQKFLGIQFIQTKHGILLHQEYVHSLLTEYGTLNTPPTSVPISHSIRLSEETRTKPVDAH